MTAIPLELEAVPSSSSVLICRVCPTYPGEFVTIINDGTTRDLVGWSFSDGEGSVLFNASFILRSHQSFTWCEFPERYQAIYPEEMVLHRNFTGLTIKGNFKLADKGDEVMLFNAAGTLMDVVYFGSSEPLPPWIGPPVPCKKGEMLVRQTPSVEFGSWGSETPGLYSISTERTEVAVTPILYPDEGLSAMVREIDRAERSIHMAAYLIENWTLARHLRSAAVRGVQVTLLLEGQPVGGVSDNGAAIAYYLQDGGAEVWIMRSSESFRRYDYLHAKYLVFDQERLLVTSENMADSSFNSNRGWAVLISSIKLAEGALEVFQRDLSGQKVDVFPLEQSLPRSTGGPGRLMSYQTPDTGQQYQATASLVSSPLMVHDLLLNTLKDADQRICLQQMSIDEGWLQDGDLMGAIYQAADRGTSVKILLDDGLGTSEPNGRTASTLNAMALQNGWDLECRLTSDLSPFERMHNKGVIIDDTVLVGSANWVDGSMERNREMMVMLESSELTRVYLGWFMDDWKGDALPPSISLPWHFMEVKGSELVFLDATACHDSSGIVEFAWDLDGDGHTDLFGPTQVLTLPKGEHNITLTATDALGNVASDRIVVKVVRGGENISSMWLYAPVPIMALLLLFKRFKGRFY